MRHRPHSKAKRADGWSRRILDRRRDRPARGAVPFIIDHLAEACLRLLCPQMALITRGYMNMPAANRMLATLALLTLPTHAHAQVAVEQFLEHVDRVCKDGPLESHSSKVELKADAKLEINNLIKKLLGVGASVGINRTVIEASGIAQDQVATAVKNGNDCRMAMMTTFKDKIDFGSTRANPLPGGTQRPPPVANADRQPSTSRERQGQVRFAAPPIAEVGLAVGDSLAKVRAAGIPGEFEVSRENVTTFRTTMQIPVQSTYGLAFRPAEVKFYFQNSAIAALLVSVFDLIDCAEADFYRSILSSTIRDLGDPVEAPQNEVKPAAFGGVPYVAELSHYKFKANGEARLITVANARGMNMPILKRCVVNVIRTRSD